MFPPKAPTRLDDLTEAGQHNVLRHLSAPPARLDWVSFVQLADAVTAVRPTFALSGVARESFTGLSAEKKFDYPAGTVVAAPGSTDDELLAAVTGLIGMSISSRAGSGSVLRRLDISEIPCWSAGKLLTATRGRLQELIADELYPRDAALNCVRLQKLVLKEAAPDMDHVFRTVGPTLISVSILEPWASCVAVLKKFRDLCPRLITICLVVEQRAQSAYATMLCFYETQLLFADLSYVPATLCRKIIAASPNMRSKMDVEMLRYIDLLWGWMEPEGLEIDEDDFPATLRALGPSLKDMRWAVDYEVPAKELSAAMRACTGVETLRLQMNPAVAVNTIQGLLSHAQPMLKSLHISLFDPPYLRHEGDPAAPLRALASSIGSLREFCYMGKIPGIGAFEIVAQSTPFLQDAKIILTETVENLIDGEGRVVDAFLACPDLRRLRFTDCSIKDRRLKRIADICTSRRVWKRPDSYVQVFSEEYLV